MVVIEAAHGFLHLIETKLQLPMVDEDDDDGNEHWYQQNEKAPYKVFLLLEYPERQNEKAHQQPCFRQKEFKGEKQHF